MSEMKGTRYLRLAGGNRCPACGHESGNPDERIWRVEERLDYEMGSGRIHGAWQPVVRQLTRDEALAELTARRLMPMPPPPDM